MPTHLVTNPKTIITDTLLALQGEIHSLQSHERCQSCGCDGLSSKNADILSKRLQRAVDAIVKLSKESREANKDAQEQLTEYSEADMLSLLLDDPKNRAIVTAELLRRGEVLPVGTPREPLLE